jgi:hypothetical protein
MYSNETVRRFLPVSVMFYGMLLQACLDLVETKKQGQAIKNRIVTPGMNMTLSLSTSLCMQIPNRSYIQISACLLLKIGGYGLRKRKRGTIFLLIPLVCLLWVMGWAMVNTC